MIGSHRSDLPAKASDHFDGQCFYNPWQPPDYGRFGFWRWLLRRRGPAWPAASKDRSAATPPRARSETARVIWLGHASVLIQIEGLSVITDPIYSRWAGPMPGVGARRRRPPAIDWPDLPPIDIVLISHAHFDHLDRPTIRALIHRDNPIIVAGLGLADWFKKRGSRRAKTLDWWQTTRPAGNLEITATPAQHWSRRGLFDRNRSLWLGFWIRSGDTAIFFAGDTGYGPHLKRIRENLGRPDLALLPIGAYEPRQWMQAQHMNPQEAVAAHFDLGARQSMGVHFATYRLTDEPFEAPARDLAHARGCHGLDASDFCVPTFGQSLEVQAMHKHAD